MLRAQTRVLHVEHVRPGERATRFQLRRSGHCGGDRALEDDSLLFSTLWRRKAAEQTPAEASGLERRRLGRFQIEWHRKYILSISCMLLFLVGSSLGAMVGRGGLGIPTLLAIAVFLLFYSLTMVGEQLVKADSLTPWAGMWLSTLTLIPIAIWLMWNASNEKRWLQGTSRT